jgi:serine/threonine-protein kinase
MKCPECQHENPADTRFCGNCGTKIQSLGDIPPSHTKTAQIPVKNIERGTTIADRYEVIEELGRGGMGNVYRVVDKKINEEMALKLLHPVIATEKKTIERFKNELKLARKITHKNVCRMYDLNEEKGTPYITMEYVPGEDLKSMIRMTGQLNVGRAVSIAKQVCEGLAEAHRLGVVHRDLKSRNIMIDKQGNARIMDFGIARSLKAEGITSEGMMIGTPEYMSPEQVKGEEVDQRSDVYSLGIILFEMVTGKIPFEGDTSITIALKHKTEEPPNPLDFNAQIPEELSALILKCMKKEKEERFQSIRETFSELEKIEKEISTLETTVSKGKYGFKSSIMSLKFFRIPGVILILALVIFAGYFFYNQILKTKAPETQTSRDTQWINSVVVLPFKHLNPNRDQENLWIVVTEAIIRKLSKFNELKVINLRTAMTYQNSEKSTSEIGKELDVANILWGTFSTEADNILINMELSPVEGSHIIKTDSYKSKLTEVFGLEDNISKSVAKLLGVQDVDKRYDRIQSEVSTDVRANEYYQIGRHFEIKYYESGVVTDFEECWKNYLKATDIDQNYALVYWRLGNLFEARFNMEDDSKYRDQMYQYFQKAYEIGPNLAEANIGLGWIHFNKGDNDEAYPYFKKAYEIDPNNAEINFNIGSFFRSIGLYELAIRHYDRALELDPVPLDFALWHNIRAICYSYMGRFDEAVAYLKKALKIESIPRLHLYYARLLILIKEYREAEIQTLEAEKFIPDSLTVKQNWALLFAALGEKERALGLIKEEDRTYLHIMTCIYSLLRMKEEALRNIQIGIDEGFEKQRWYLYSYLYLKNNPCYDNLRDDVRFQEIMIKEEIKYEEKIKKYRDL